MPCSGSAGVVRVQPGRSSCIASCTAKGFCHTCRSCSSAAPSWTACIAYGFRPACAQGRQWHCVPVVSKSQWWSRTREGDGVRIRRPHKVCAEKQVGLKFFSMSCAPGLTCWSIEPCLFGLLVQWSRREAMLRLLSSFFHVFAKFLERKRCGSPACLSCVCSSACIVCLWKCMYVHMQRIGKHCMQAHCQETCLPCMAVAAVAAEANAAPAGA